MSCGESSNLLLVMQKSQQPVREEGKKGGCRQDELGKAREEAESAVHLISSHLPAGSPSPRPADKSPRFMQLSPGGTQRECAEHLVAGQMSQTLAAMWMMRCGRSSHGA